MDECDTILTLSLSEVLFQTVEFYLSPLLVENIFFLGAELL